MSQPQRIVTLTPETWNAIRALVYELEFARSQAQEESEPGMVMARVQNAQALFKQVAWGWSEGPWPPAPGELSKVTWSDR